MSGRAVDGARLACGRLSAMSWNLKAKAQTLLAQEKGTVRKDWGGRVSFALVYPNTYAVGMSNLGLPDDLPASERAPRRRVRARVPARPGGPGRVPAHRHRRRSRWSPSGRSPTSTSWASRSPTRATTSTRSGSSGWPASRSAPAERRPRGSPRPDGRRVRLRQPRAHRAVHGLRGRRGGRGDRRGDRSRRTGRLRRDVPRRSPARGVPGPARADPRHLRAPALRGRLPATTARSPRVRPAGRRPGRRDQAAPEEGRRRSGRSRSSGRPTRSTATWRSSRSARDAAAAAGSAWRARSTGPVRHRSLDALRETVREIKKDSNRVGLVGACVSDYPWIGGLMKVARGGRASRSRSPRSAPTA